MMYDGWGWGWGGWVLMSVAMVLFWAVLITALVLSIRYLVGGGRPGTTRPDPARAEDLLAERFARGEIEEDEFRRRMTLLREHR